MQEGDVLVERFVVQRLAGQGAMGEVWRAEDRATGLPVAVKVLLPQTVDVARFVREATFLAGIRHAHVVGYVEHGEERGRHFLVTEWLEGEDLAQRLRRGTLSLEDALTVVARVADGLGEVHARGVVHRDVKPSNVFLPGGDLSRAKLIDFGIARALDRTATIGMVLGTPYYVAPEQAQGRDVDPRADVWSLGCVLFECVRGRPPFDGDQLMAVLGKILFEATPVTRVPALDDLLGVLLAKDRELRPRDGREVQRLLEAAGSASSRHTPAAARAPREQVLVAVLGIGDDARPELDSWAPTAVLGPLDLSSLAERFGGRQATMMDGSRVVVFEAAGAATDLAERAGRCALAIRDVDPSLRIAVALGHGDTASASPVGPALDRVAALLAETGLGDVAVDATAAGLMRSLRLDESAGAARLVGAEGGEAERLVLGRPTAFIGRERELSSLLGLFEAVAEDRIARCALVTAPPGVGKSRLTRELVRAVRARPDVSVWAGAGDPVGVGSPLGILASLVRDALGLGALGSLPERRAAVRAGVQRLHVPAASEERIAAFLGELCGVRFADEARPELAAARKDAALLGDQMRRAFEDLVEAACERGPVFLVLEDLHWGDAATVDFVEGALRRCQEAPLFVLALGRPEVTERFPKLWASRQLTTLHLGGLPKRAALDLVRTILPQLPSGEAERVVATADGNAFYLEELVRSIGSGRGEEMPETVLAMVEARLSLLGARPRRVLRAASVFGESFTAAALSSVLGAPVDDDLAELERRELIFAREGVRSPLARIAFRHALLRDAAYAGLNEEDRRALHLGVARYAEASGEADVAVLAEHFERGGAEEEAARAWGGAAELALRSGALREALDRARRAMELGADPGPQLGLSADAASWLGETELAGKYAASAMAALQPGGVAWCRALAVAALSSAQLGRRADLLGLSRHALSIPSVQGAEEARVIAQCRVAVQYAIVGRLDLLEQVLSQVDATELPAEALLGRAWRHRLRANRGMYRADLQAYQDGSEEALRLFRAADDARSEAWQRVNVGCGLALLGDYEMAIRQLELAVSAADALATHGVLRYGQEYLANALRRVGRLGEARALAEEVAAASMARGDRTIACQAHAEVAWCLLSEGAIAEAEAEARRAGALLGGASQHAREPATLLAAIALAEGRAGEALRRIEPVIQGATEEYWEEDGVEWALHVEALLGVGRTDEAREAAVAGAGRLEQRAAHLRSADRRFSYLTLVAEHARLLALRDRLAGEREARG